VEIRWRQNETNRATRISEGGGEKRPWFHGKRSDERSPEPICLGEKKKKKKKFKKKGKKRLKKMVGPRQSRRSRNRAASYGRTKKHLDSREGRGRSAKRSKIR